MDTYLAVDANTFIFRYLRNLARCRQTDTAVQPMGTEKEFCSSGNSGRLSLGLSRVITLKEDVRNLEGIQRTASKEINV